METNQPPKSALPLLVLLALASALGIAVAVALAGVAMLLAAPAYAGEGSLLLERLAGFYLHRLPENAVVERLALTVLAVDADPAPAAAAARHAVLTLSAQATLTERTAEIGAGETLLVELEYRQVLRYDRARTGSRLLTLR